jgi:hypothetical protein
MLHGRGWRVQAIQRAAPSGSRLAEHVYECAARFAERHRRDGERYGDLNLLVRVVRSFLTGRLVTTVAPGHVPHCLTTSCRCTLPFLAANGVVQSGSNDIALLRILTTGFSVSNDAFWVSLRTGSASNPQSYDTLLSSSYKNKVYLHRMPVPSAGSYSTGDYTKLVATLALPGDRFSDPANRFQLTLLSINTTDDTASVVVSLYCPAGMYGATNGPGCSACPTGRYDAAIISAGAARAASPSVHCAGECMFPALFVRPCQLLRRWQRLIECMPGLLARWLRGRLAWCTIRLPHQLDSMVGCVRCGGIRLLPAVHCHTGEVVNRQCQMCQSVCRCTSGDHEPGEVYLFCLVLGVSWIDW